MSKEASDPVAFQDAVRDSAERDDIAMPVGLWSYTNKKNDSVIAIRIQDDGRFVLQILAPKVNEQGEVIDSVVVANLEGVFKIKGAVLMADKLIGEKKLLPASGLLVVRLVNNEHLVLEDDKKLSSIYFTKG